MRRLPRRLLVALALLSTVATARAGSIRFGAVLPLTGPAAPIGAQQRMGIQAAVDQANAAGGVRGNRIDVLFEDSQANPHQAVLAFNRLADTQDVPVIFTARSGPTLAMAPLATRRKILLVNAGAQADSLATASPYLVNTVPPIRDEIAILSQYLVAEGRKQGVILYEDAAAGIAARDDYVKYFAEAGGTILAQQAWQFGKTDFRPALLDLAYARPDVMLVAITAGLLPMAEQYRHLGLDFMVAGTTWLADPAMIASPAAEGFVHTQLRIDAPPELAAAFKAKFGIGMDEPARQYCNATQIVLTVADRVLAEGKTPTGEAMRDTLLRIRTFQGLVPLTFNGNTASAPLEIDVIRGGKDVTIKPSGID